MKYKAAHPERKAKYEGSKRRWRVRNKKRDYLSIRKGYLKREFGLTLEDYAVMFARQKGLCAICEKPETGSKSLAVDHDHTTGKIRGLLCLQCNTKLGWFETFKEQITKYPGVA